MILEPVKTLTDDTEKYSAGWTLVCGDARVGRGARAACKNASPTCCSCRCGAMGGAWCGWCGDLVLAATQASANVSIALWKSIAGRVAWAPGREHVSGAGRWRRCVRAASRSLDARAKTVPVPVGAAACAYRARVFAARRLPVVVARSCRPPPLAARRGRGRIGGGGAPAPITLFSRTPDKWADQGAGISHRRPQRPSAGRRRPPPLCRLRPPLPPALLLPEHHQLCNLLDALGALLKELSAMQQLEMLLK